MEHVWFRVSRYPLVVDVILASVSSGSYRNWWVSRVWRVSNEGLLAPLSFTVCSHVDSE